MMRRLTSALVLLAALCGGSLPALAQSGCSYIATGAVLTAAQWNQCFAQKQNTLGYTAVNRAGDTMTGRLTMLASTTSFASMNVPPGTAPTSPNNGDIWATTAGLFVRANGVTVGPLIGAAGASFAATTPLSVSFPSGTITYALTGIVPVANGGTGTSTAFTTGNIVFAGASGVYSQNVSLAWDNSIKLLSLNLASGAPYAAETGTQLQLTGLDGFATTMFTDSFGSTSAWDCRFASGTYAARTAAATGQTMCQWNAQGYDGAAYAKSGRVRWRAAPSGGTWTAGDHGTELAFFTTAAGGTTTTEKLTLKGDGTLQAQTLTLTTPLASAYMALGTNVVTGAVRCDGTTTTCSGGVVTAVGAVAASIGVGTTTITSGTTTRILYDNAGVIGEYTISGTGTVAVMQQAPRVNLLGIGAASNAVNSAFIKQAADTAGAHGIKIEASGSDKNFYIGFVTAGSPASAQNTWQINAAYGASGLFSPITFITTDLERLRIDANGNIGIGAITSPSAQLHTNGTVRFAGIASCGTGTVANLDSSGNLSCVSSAARTKLVAAQTFFVRKDGSDSNTCLTDSAGGACLTFQAAINKALAFDFGGQSQTVKRGSDAGVGTFTENITIVNCVGGGDLSITGVPTSFATATNTVLTSGSGTTISVSFCPTNVRIGGITISCNAGSGRGIFTGYQGTVTITTFIRFGACDQQMINHDLQGLIQALSISVEIFGGGSCHICNGGQFFYESVAMTLTSTPQFNVAWLSCSAGKVQTSGLSTVSGTAIGFKYKIYNNCGVDTVGQDADSVFPGSNTLGPFGAASIGNKPMALGIYDAGSLPTCNVNWQGTIVFAYSASNAGTWSSTIAGGGGAFYLAWCNGSAWTEVGK